MVVVKSLKEHMYHLIYVELQIIIKCYKTSSTMDNALRRRIRGLINRLGVDNIEPVIKDILKLYDENSTKKSMVYYTMY